jgi:cell division initiation protein
MITPQELDQISFGKQTFGGYDMQQVDDLLGRLLDDYVALYKENALLKSKMRVLVSKLEDYRKNEASMKEALAETQQNCDQMLKDTEAKCAQMLETANAEAA